MASLFLSVLGRAEQLRSKLRDLFSSSPSTSSFPSSSTFSSQISKDLENLYRRMQRIRAFLSDAENREIIDSGVKLWLEELRDVGYEAEDLIEDVEDKLMRNQLLCKEAHGERLPDHTTLDGRGINKRKREEVGISLIITPPCTPLVDASFQEQILSKINNINERFNHIYEDRYKLELREEDGQRCGAAVLQTPARIPSSCLVDVGGVRGREDDKSEVIKKLLSDVDQVDGHCKKNVRVVSLVGMGGLGKTTLAQLVYNDNLVRNHFELRLWVCVSDRFDVIRLTKAILEQIEKTPNQLEQFNSVQESLFEKLRGKRFFLVLDDVWNEKYEDWEALWVALSSGADGSRVLITTRSEKVSKICHVIKENMYRLGCLSDEDSWSLFEQRAFGGRGRGDYPNLVKIGQKIVRKCKGLPLTLKTLAALLSCDLCEDRWDDILRNELWELPEGEDHVLPILKLSYYHLPSPIKPCFAYCAVFPKDYKFNRDQLVWMWMAQGYIGSTASRCMKDVGRGYFEYLLQRSFFQQINEENSAFKYKRHSDCFIMHDLIHDLACSIWKGECCEAKDSGESNDRARHLRFTPVEGMRTLRTKEVPPEILKRTRTCVVTRIELIWNDMLSRMKYLRVLHVTDSDIRTLPDSIGNLTHLRYLHISSWSLVKLPESLGNLHNLQSLEVESQEILNLPESILEVTDLRYHRRHRNAMPRGIGRLTQLRRLPLFVVGDGNDDARIEELMGLNALQGDLKIYMHNLNSSSNSSGGKEATCNILKNKEGLESLTLLFPFQQMNYIRQQEEERLETLQPHINLKHLTIEYYSGGRFPKWVGDPSYLRLESMCLMFCITCEQLSVGRDEGGVLPRLRELIIDNCPDLKYLKLRHLTALTTLTITRCNQLTTLDYYDDQYLQPPQGEAVYYSHIPSLKIMDIRGNASLTQKHWVESHLDKLPRNLTLLYSWNTTMACNVVDVKEASAIFSSNSCTPVILKLVWDLKQQSILSTPAEAERVLYHLCHPWSPKSLFIQGYQGRCFPNWVGDPQKLSLVTELTLSDCVNSKLLPPLHLLPELRELRISNMPRWEECQLVGVDGGEFPKLRVLTIDNCLKLSKVYISGLQALTYVFITNLLALEELLVSDCRELVYIESLHGLPSLQILSITGCPVSSPTVDHNASDGEGSCSDVLTSDWLTLGGFKQ